MKKMKDDDIIEALDLCSKRSLKQYLCTKCPLHHEDCYGGALIKPLALDLINRQKAEIERLRESAKTLSDALADIEEVHGRWETNPDDIYWGNAVKRKYCTACKKEPHFDREKREFILTDYCPNCGAKMDEEEKHG